MTQALNLANFANTLNTAGQTSNSGLQNSSVTVTAGTGMSGGGAVALGSSVTLNNAGVTSIIAGSGISVSGATGAVTINNTAPLTVKQIVQVVKQDVFTTTSTDYVDVTGLSATITPTSTSSRIMVEVFINAGGNASTYHCYWQLCKNGTAISGALGTGGQPFPVTLHKNINDTRDMDVASMNYIDSPATLSPITYNIKMAVQLNTFYINRGGNSDPWTPAGISSITLSEIV